MTLAADDDIIQAAVAGDTSAFESLLAPLLDPAFKLAALLLRDHAEAEDAVQEAAVRAWARIDQVRGDRTGLRAWFLTIVANQCKSMRRRSWWGVIRLPDVVRSDTWANAEPEARIDLREAIGHLARDDQFALFAFFYLDLPLHEAARVMGVPLSTAKSRIYRAVRRLRRDITAEEVFKA